MTKTRKSSSSEEKRPGKKVAGLEQQAERTHAFEKELEATNQQLNAMNQQLLASEQQLKAANQQLIALNQQLVAGEKKLKRQLEISEKQRIANLVLLNDYNQSIKALKAEIIRREKTENSLKASQDLLELTGRMAKVGGWELDAATKEVTWSEETYRIHEYPLNKKPPFRAAVDFFHPDDRPRLKKAIKRALAEGKPYDMELRFITAKGKHLITHTIGKVLKRNGKIIKLYGSFQDITALKKAEKALEIKNRISRIFLENEDQGMYGAVLDVVLEMMESPHGVFGYISARGDLVCPSMTKEIWDECRMLGKTIVFPKETWGDSLWGHGLRNKKGAYANKPFKVPAGHLPVDRFLTVPLVYRNRSIGLLSVGNKSSDYTEEDFRLLQDIAAYIAPVLAARLERIRSLRALEESEKRFELAMNASEDGLYDWDLVTNEIYFSPGWKRMLGYGYDELPNDFSVWERLTDPEDIKKSWAMQNEVVQRKRDRFELEFKMKHKDGHWVDILSRAQAVFDTSGKAIRMIGTHVDITELKCAQQRIQKELEEKKTLIRELHHRTKNNMQVISSMLKLYGSRRDDRSIQDFFKDIQSKIDSMALVHRNLMQSGDLSKIDLKDYFDSLIDGLKLSYSRADQKIDFTTDIQSVQVLIDTAIPLGLVMTELVTNAFKHAFPGRETGEIRITLGQSPKKAVILEVSDNGVGLPDGFRFDNSGRLGLAMAKMLIEHQLNGEIRFSGDQGLTCRIVIKKEVHEARI